MRRIRTLRFALSALLLAGLCTGVTTAPTAAATPPASPGLLTAMERDLGLTPEQARDRLAAELKAAKAEKSAKRTAGASYAGSWFDAGSGRLTVAVADADADRTSALRELGVDVRQVTRSEAELRAAQRRLDALDAPAGISSWHVDPKLNAIVVNVVDSKRDRADVQRFLATARRTAPVRTATVTAAPTTFAAGTVGGDPYYTDRVRCSIGFSVHGGFVTAGHCGQPGTNVWGWDGSWMGTFQGSTFPGDDMAWVRIGGGWWTVPVVLGWGQVPDQLVRGSWEAPVGSSVCRSGSTTHWHCGAVLAKWETVNYSQGAVYEMTKTSVCAEGGDSGGSYITGDQAQGVTSGGWGNCSSGGQTWFQPVNEILGRYGLTLHTW